MTLATRRSVHRLDPRPSSPIDAAGSSSISRVDATGGPPADAPHGRRRAERPPHSPSTSGWMRRLVVPAAVLLVVAVGSALAWFAAPEHPGPLSGTATLVLVVLTGPLVFLASRRIRLTVAGGLTAAALSALLQTTASSDVVGVMEHTAIVAGLVAVWLWPRGDASVRRRSLAGALTGLAVAVSPFALVATALALGLLLARSSERRRTLRSLLLPAVVGVAVAGVLVGTMTLVAGGPDAGTWLGATSWAGGFSLATFVVAAAPAIGVAAGMAIDASTAALRSKDAGELTIGIIGILTVGLLLAAALGGSVAQIRDRMIAGDLEPDDALVADTDAAGTERSSADPSANAIDTSDPAAAERADQGAQLLRNPRLTTTSESRELLQQGAVDSRVMIVLAQLLTVHDLTVADFPAAADETSRDGSSDSAGPAVRRQLLVSVADGATLQTGGASIPALTAYLSGLDDDFAVESVSVDSTGVLATFAPLSSPTPTPAGAP